MESFLQNNRTLIILEGVLFMILGFLAVIMPEISTISIEIFLGWLALFGGAVQLFRSIQHRSAPGFYGSLFTSLLYIIFGILLLANPLSGVISLTLLLIFFFLIEGIAKIYYGFSIQPRTNSVWLIINGLLAIGMAAIIFLGWPGTAFWVLGLLLGINMIFFGLALLLFGIGLPKANPQ